MWFGQDWLLEAGFVAKLMYSVPNPWQANTSSLRQKSGFIPVAFLSVCISKAIPGCCEAFTQKQSYLGDVRQGWRGWERQGRLVLRIQMLGGRRGRALEWLPT